MTQYRYKHKQLPFFPETTGLKKMTEISDRSSGVQVGGRGFDSSCAVKTIDVELFLQEYLCEKRVLKKKEQRTCMVTTNSHFEL